MQLVLGVTTRNLMDILRTVAVSEVIAYEDIARRLGTSDVENVRGALGSARNILRRDERIVFRTIRGVGLERASDSLVPALSRAQSERAASAAKVGIQTLACADISKLSRDERIMFDAQASVLSAVALVTSNKAEKVIKDKVERAGASLDLSGTLGLFSK